MVHLVLRLELGAELLGCDGGPVVLLVLLVVFHDNTCRDEFNYNLNLDMQKKSKEILEDERELSDAEEDVSS